MWSDNETATDLLGFKVHADLIKSVVTDSALLPVVLGVFGDWGGGKSSIMKMLEQDLNSEEYKDVVCLYFNGWMFEGYEDAKTALLSSILIQLGEHKRFGAKAKEKVTGLLKRVKWMEVAKLSVKHVGVPLAAGLLTGGAGILPALLASMTPTLKSSEPNEVSAKKEKKEDKNEINWLDLIKEDPGKPDLLEIRKFRQDFEDMLAQTKIKSLVILIDDLDRCLPERIIETLEAIKLFVAVPRTAFVIGADPRIVRHAIATRYVARQLRRKETNNKEEYDLVTDYLEKLIQIPYHLPRLSPSEVETYINLLACQKSLDDTACAVVLNHWAEKRRSNFHAAYRQGGISEALKGSAVPDELASQLSWSNSIALVLTEGLKGNPRQIKRMLNAMLLRKKLAQIAGMDIKDEILAKLMVLEYTHPKLFETLNDWQTAESGFPEKLRELEEAALAEDSERQLSETGLTEWSLASVRRWLQMQPPLGEVDLRDYFWLARDRTSSTLAGVTMVSTLVRRLFDQLVGDNEGEHRLALRAVRELDEMERASLLNLLQQQVERHPDDEGGANALYLLTKENISGAAPTLLKALRNASAVKIAPAVIFKIEALVKSDAGITTSALDLLRYLSGYRETRIGIAAEQAIKAIQTERE
jgi:predicted KAP-like P-loop ATPase